MKGKAGGQQKEEDGKTDGHATRSQKER
jgi:hypothetical protein